MAVLENTKLQTKLLLAFFCVSLITLAVGLLGVQRIHQIVDADSFLYEKVTVPLGEIADIAVSFQRVRINLRDAVESTDKAEVAAAKENIKNLGARITERMASFEKTIVLEEVRKNFAELKQARQDYLKVMATILELDAAGKDEEAKHLITGEGRKAAQHYQGVIDKLVEAKEKQGERVDKQNDEIGESATRLMYGLMVVGFIASIMLGLLLTRNVMTQLGEDPGYLAEVAGKIAGGDLDVAFRAQKRQGGVYHVIQGMVATMKAKIAESEEKSAEAAEQARQAQIATEEATQAKAAAERAKAEGMLQAARKLEGVVEVVTSASEELSAQIEQSNRGAEEQANRVSETATAMEEMNATVLEVAKNAQQAAGMSDQARKQAQEGAGIVGNVVKGIGAVRSQSEALKTDMAELGKQAEAIGQIMNVISDIADQTNLLALNAAIEAARAGDAGRGFAVVADEVRKLAEKTMQATKEVGDAIRGIQDGTRKNMENVDRSAGTIVQATDLATRSGESLSQIVSLVDQTSDQVRAIATASEQQSAASEEINRSVEQVATISAETAQAMGQANQAVSELARQAQILQSLINEMKAQG